jgi:GntP family gluconate:H+ symporter
VDPLIILLIAIIAVVGMIIVLRVNAFLALTTAAILVSLLAPGPAEDKISRVAREFGNVAGSIGIVIALAAIVAKCLLDSGAADQIVRSFLRALGEKRASWALLASAFVLSIPVFFDTVFYLLAPLARSLWRRTHRNYILYVTAVVAGAAITHNLVPPTPGPLFAADRFGIDLGTMILIGILIALPTAVVAMLACTLINRFMDVPMRPYTGEVEPEPLVDEQLPPLWLSLLPVVLPVLLISANTIAKACAKGQSGNPDGPAFMTKLATVTSILGQPNLALLISAVIAMALLAWKRRLSLKQLTQRADEALTSGGIIILITAGGGALGGMLRAAGIQDSVTKFMATGEQGTGLAILAMGFATASLIKFAQGSSTVAIITASSMFAAMGITSEVLGCHVVYLATAICSGALFGDWMNDSGFWVVARMSVLTEVETLKSFTIITAVVSLTGFGFTLLVSRLMPMV